MNIKEKCFDEDKYDICKLHNLKNEFFCSMPECCCFVCIDCCKKTHKKHTYEPVSIFMNDIKKNTLSQIEKINIFINNEGSELASYKKVHMRICAAIMKIKQEKIAELLRYQNEKLQQIEQITTNTMQIFNSKFNETIRKRKKIYAEAYKMREKYKKTCKITEKNQNDFITQITENKLIKQNVLKFANPHSVYQVNINELKYKANNIYKNMKEIKVSYNLNDFKSLENRKHVLKNEIVNLMKTKCTLIAEINNFDFMFINLSKYFDITQRNADNAPLINGITKCKNGHYFGWKIYMVNERKYLGSCNICKCAVFYVNGGYSCDKCKISLCEKCYKNFY